MNQTVDSGPWFFGKSMLALEVYDGLCDPSSVALPSIPVWVWILGLLTVAATQLVVETLGSVINLNMVGIRWGDQVCVRIRHLLSDPVKHAFPLRSLSSLLGWLLYYEKVVGFFKVCGLLEHGTGGYLGFPTLTVWIMYGLFFNYLGYEWHSFIRSEKSLTEFSPFKILITPVYRNPFFRRQFSFQFYFKFLLRRSKIGCCDAYYYCLALRLNRLISSFLLLLGIYIVSHPHKLIF